MKKLTKKLKNESSSYKDKKKKDIKDKKLSKKNMEIF